MEKNDAVKKHSCELCNYTTYRKYDLKRHHTAKHIINILSNTNEKNVAPNEKNVAPNEKNVAPTLICKKCSKIYKTKKCLISHELKCKGIDELTCPRCMISFTTRQHKSRHIINNKCKPRSIIYARKPHIETITNNITTQNNINTQNNNTIIINNYGNERIDYLDYDKMLEIFKNAYNIPSILTKHIHFNNEFPENQNISCCDDDKNYSLVKINDEFIFRNVNTLVKELIKDKTRLMHKFAAVNKDNICIKMDIRIYEEIIDLLLKLLLLQEPSDHYKIQVGIIRDMIKNSNNI